MTSSDVVNSQPLRSYLQDVLPQIGDIQDISKFKTGQSNPTYLVKGTAQSCVLRAKPPGELLKSAHQVEREFRVMQALAPTDVPVPQMLHLSADEVSPLGRAFFVMEFLPGRVLWDPALPDETPQARGAIYEAMARALAALHRLEPETLGLGDFGRPGNYFARQLARWQKQYLASAETPDADMLYLADWMTERLPDDDELRLVHGDYRLDNMLFAEQSAEILGIVDWELSTLGHPLADLAYQSMQLRLPHGTDMKGLGGLDRRGLGIPSETDYVELYCSFRGIGMPQFWSVYLVFSYYRLAAILEGVVARARSGNASNPAQAKALSRAIPLLIAQARDLTREAGT